MDAETAREIVSFVEDSEGNIRLDNMVRETRYQYAKGYLDCLENGPEVKALVEALEYYCDHKIEGYVPKDHNQPLCELNFREKALAAFKKSTSEGAVADNSIWGDQIKEALLQAEREGFERGIKAAADKVFKMDNEPSIGTVVVEILSLKDQGKVGR